MFVSLFYAPILTFALAVRHVSHLDTCLRTRRNLPFCRTKAYLSQLDRCLMPRAPLCYPCFDPIISLFCALFAPKFRHNFCSNYFNTNGSLYFNSWETITSYHFPFFGLMSDLGLYKVAIRAWHFWGCSIQNNPSFNVWQPEMGFLGCLPNRLHTLAAAYLKLP